MVQEPSFILDLEGKFMCLDTARIITGDDLDTLVSIFNSKLFFYAVKRFYGGGSLGETGVRMKHTFFEKFPMPLFSENTKSEIKKMIENSDFDSIDKIIYDHFNLEEDETMVIGIQ